VTLLYKENKRVRGWLLRRFPLALIGKRSTIYQTDRGFAPPIDLPVESPILHNCCLYYEDKFDREENLCYK